MKSIELPREWWKDAVVYQIYTRSFLDSNGDGIGDFGGVIAQLDYLQRLGVDVIWLSPFCDSPNDDNGYDISDYRRIHPEFGDLEQFVIMASEAHRRGIKIMMDLVMNHTSDEHPWFVESRSSRDNPKRDWYIWRDPAPGGGKPNNWDSYFGGAAWEWDEQTGQYYLHTFSTKQPDLNWANPAVRQEMHRIAEFWIAHGVNAFRLDAVHHIGKPVGLPDYTDYKHEREFRLYKNLPETHAYLQEMHDQIFAPHNVFTVGETGGTTPGSSRKYVDRDRGELNMIHHFEQLFLPNPGNAADIQRNMQRWFKALSRRGWDAQFFSNHDLPRQVSAFGNDRELRGKSAAAIATVLLTAWGTPFIYQGEEIGMTNFPFAEMDDFRDRHGLSWYQRDLAHGEDPELAWARMLQENRDNSRTPMQWSEARHAGFTAGEPWIPVNPNHVSVNVAAQESDSDSTLSWYRRLIALRRQHRVLRRGSFRILRRTASRDVVCFVRRLSGKPQAAGEVRRVLVLVNWTGSQAEARLPRRIAGASRRRFSCAAVNYRYRDAGRSLSAEGRKTVLRPYEARVYLEEPKKI
ncbi:alpha-glucosidase [Spirochaeta africana]|uniref:Glycosidase n=1 Tax=Spirochaeta africana (strain ATCC 700263 / DSM 8902 / Z-7692) TaxID=889378 RepID=H9UM67_SPIAZ|nr:alpha-glucosidase [Spirochaeta africana]AFG38610.1 glycosidase [Spirochaeta africana DSM 8902]